MKEIPLTKGKVALVDDEDYDWLVAMGSWCAALSNHRIWYAVRTVRINRKNTTAIMHRVILRAPPGITVDHRDHDGLHNWKDNLRLATLSQQRMNVKRRLPGYKGVYHKTKRWHAQIRIKQQLVNLGSYLTPEEAAQAYNAAAIEHFGEFASLNILGDQP